MIEKFPTTGINVVQEERGLTSRILTPGQFLSPADRFIPHITKIYREQAIRGIETIPFSERQDFVIDNIAIPAAMQTASEILGEGTGLEGVAGTFISLLDPNAVDIYRNYTPQRVGGVYYGSRNQIIINQAVCETDSPDHLANLAKVTIHEYFHFLSHQFSSLGARSSSPLRIGFMARGEDIRKKNEGNFTWDYFRSFNEAMTEMLAIRAREAIADNPIFTREDGSQAPGYKTYAEYRELTEAVIHDSVKYGVSNMPEEQVFRFIAKGYLTGDLKPLLDLVRATYPGLRIKEFALMTKASDLPTREDFVPVSPDDGDDGSLTLSFGYLERLRDKLNGKPSSEYKSDSSPTGPKPPSPPPSLPPTSVQVRLRREISNHRTEKVKYAHMTPGEDGLMYDRNGNQLNRDENGNVIHYDEKWLIDALSLIIELGQGIQAGKLSAELAAQAMDKWLFEINHISELSDGFEEFYVSKHRLFEHSGPGQDFLAQINDLYQRVSDLRAEYNFA